MRLFQHRNIITSIAYCHTNLVEIFTDDFDYLRFLNWQQSATDNCCEIYTQKSESFAVLVLTQYLLQTTAFNH